MANLRSLSILRRKKLALLHRILGNEYIEDYNEEYLAILRLLQRKSRPELVKIIGYFEITVPAYFDDDFRRHFRLSRTIFEDLMRRLAPMLVGDVFGRPEIVLEKKVLIVLWLLGNLESFRSIGDRFHVSKSTVESCFQQVIHALNLLSGTLIVWPTGQERLDVIAGFAAGAGFPGVVGAIDGTHIRITAPNENPEVYVNRKQHHSIVLQAVCNDRLFFTDCFAGYPGSVHDARVFRNSTLFQRIQDNPGFYFGEDAHLLGDPAYPLFTWLMTAYRNNGYLNPEQRRFNYVLSVTRSKIERAFALLKARFRRLKLLHMNRTDLIAQCILAACVLHNICLMNEDDVEYFLGEGRYDDNEEPLFDDENDFGNAQEKRNQLCHEIFNQEY